MHTYAQPRRQHERLAAALGWFSLALGTAEVVVPRTMARLIGMPDDPRLVNVLRTFGAREIVSGLGLLTQPGNAVWAWSRVGGDAIDLAFLGSAAAEETANHQRVALAAGAVAGVAALDFICARGLQDQRARERPFAAPAREGLTAERAVTVQRPIAASSTNLRWAPSSIVR